MARRKPPKPPKTAVVAFKVENELAELLNQLPNKSAFIRKAIAAQLTTRSGPATDRAGGSAVVNQGVGKAVVKGLAIAEAIAIPLTMILLVVAFGSVVAAAMPVMIGLISIVTTLAVL